MTKFSDFFKDYMQRHNCSQRRLATRLCLSRRTIGRWVSGEACPPSLDKVEEIVEKLSLSDEERNELYRIFYRNQQGEAYCHAAKVMQTILDFQLKTQDEKSVWTNCSIQTSTRHDTTIYSAKVNEVGNMSPGGGGVERNSRKTMSIRWLPVV